MSTALPVEAEAIRDALLEGDAEKATAATQAALDKGADPLALIQDVVVPALSEVGRRFEALEVFLPELMESGAAGRAVSDLIEAELTRRGGSMKSAGVVVIGTVKGDIHDIGKNIVASLFKAQGFKVIDLGKDVPATRFLEVAEENKADIIAASALMSITRAGCREVADLLRSVNKSDRFIYLVGGGSVDEAYASEIGASGYAKSASGGVEVGKALLAQQAQQAQQAKQTKKGA
jgi:5-methyltetrahydrofolate--homocysteine methyltransferase